MQFIFKYSLFAVMLVIWSLIWLAKVADYDTNYVYYFVALIVSLLITIAIIATWIIKKQFIKFSTVSTILFLITSSPISLEVFLNFYVEFVGSYFKN